MDQIAGISYDGFCGAGAVVTVKVQIKNMATCEYWNGCEWTAEETWLNTTGIPNPIEILLESDAISTYNILFWSYSCDVPFSEIFCNGGMYQISAIAGDNIGQYSDVVSECFTWVSTPCVTIDGGVYPTIHAIEDVWGTVYDPACPVDVKVTFIPKDNPSDTYCPDVCLQPAGPGMTHWSVNVDQCIIAQYDEWIISVIAADSSLKANLVDKQPPYNVSAPVTMCFVYIPTDDQIRLYNGWNFISFPMNLDAAYNSFEELFSDFDCGTIQVVVGYDAFEECPWMCVSDVMVLNGYWIYVCTSPFGDKIAVGFNYSQNGGETPVVPASKELKGDAWNAIGPTGWSVTRYDQAVQEGLDGMNNCPALVTNQLKSIEGSWSTLISYDAECQKYDLSHLCTRYSFLHAFRIRLLDLDQQRRG
jgi:hypothetical protein